MPRVLVVDDDPSILLFVREALDFEGFQVQVAVDGLQALEVLEAEPHPCLLLLDMRMPRLDGWGVSQALQERGWQIPTCVMTAAQDAGRGRARSGRRRYCRSRSTWPTSWPWSSST